MIIWTLNALVMGLILGYLVAEKIVGLKIIVERTVYHGQPSIRVLNVNVQAPAFRRVWAL